MRAQFLIYGKNLDGFNNESMLLKRTLRKVGIKDADATWVDNPYFIKRVDYVLVVGAYALHKLLPQTELTYCAGQPIRAHGKVLYPIDHPFTILNNREGYANWERQLRLFNAMMNDITVTPRTIQDMHAHCMYCDRMKVGELTCHAHLKTLLRDRATRLVPPMIEPTLF